MSTDAWQSFSLVALSAGVFALAFGVRAVLRLLACLERERDALRVDVERLRDGHDALWDAVGDCERALGATAGVGDAIRRADEAGRQALANTRPVASLSEDIEKILHRLYEVERALGERK